mgnify:CR=1 FL=1
MGHRIEPYVSIPTKLQTDSTGYNPRVSNSHWLLFPITATIESVRFYVIIYKETDLKPSFIRSDFKSVFIFVAF